MSPRIEWIPAYSVGREDIDNQHKSLFRLVDDIPATWDHKDLKKSVMKLFKYTREHFTAEEKILAAINYPHMEEHKRYHEELITQLTVFGDTGFSNEKALLDFKDFAYNWITDHILQEDLKYVKYVHDNNLSWGKE